MRQVAIITGASRKIGIGAAIARKLAQQGVQLFTCYYRPYDATMPWGSQANEAQDLMMELRGLGVEADGMELDLADPTSAETLFNAAESALGPVSILVNNATYSTMGGIDTLSAEILDAHYAVNVRATALLCAEFARRWQGTTGGRIINMSSGQSHGPMPDEIAYATTKGAVEALTLSLSAALMARGITVNAIDPGATDTGWISAELRSHLEAQSPLGRVGQPEDVARLAGFVVSAEGDWITGQILRSRGGM